MKTLVHLYRFIPSENKVIVKGIHTLKRFLLITNATDNKTIFTFNSQNNGVTDIAHDFEAEETILTLDFDCSSMEATDELQIFFESDQTVFEPSETFVDPVSKIRVSNPENLIDTDFEYGLQATKWETLELSNNVPSFYVSESDLPIENLQSVSATTGSNVIQVFCAEPHNLVAGTPIDVIGLTSRTAEGKFIIKTTPSATLFTYEANGPQTITGNIGNIYTAITPGQFYSGSQIPFRADVGIITDGASPSKLTVTTQAAHGFEEGSNFYLINSIGTKFTGFDPTLNLNSTAPDGRPFVDTLDTINKNFNPTMSLTETKQMRSTYYLKFNASAVNTSTGTITWNNHRFRENDTLVYVPPANDTQIGGLERFQVYYVHVFDSNRIRLRTSYNGSIVSFSSTGTYNFGRAGLHMCYETFYFTKLYAEYYTRHLTTHNYQGVGSGWDLGAFAPFGLGGTRGTHRITFSPNGNNWGQSVHGYLYSTAYRSGMRMPDSSNTPGLYNWIEDFTRYFPYDGFSNNSTRFFNSTYFDTYDTTTSYWSGNNNYYLGHRQMFVMFLVSDEEADTFYFQNHGLNSGDTASLGILSGSNIFVSNSDTNVYNENGYISYGGGSYPVEKVSNDRFRVVFPGSRSRLAYVTGTYSISSQTSNPTKNSFYIPAHGYSTGTPITFSLGDSGVKPSTNSGKAVFDTRIEQGTIKAAWNVLKSSMDNYVSTLSGHQNLVLNGQSSSLQPINSGVASGSSLLNFFTLDRSPFLQSLYRLQTNVSPTNDLYFNRQSPNIVKDAGQGTTFAGQGWSYIGTEFAQNTAVPHYSLLWGYAHPINQDVTDFRVYNRTSASSMSTHGVNNQTYTIEGDNSWRASYFARFGTSPSASGYVEFNIVIWNEANWTPLNSDPQYTFINNGNNSILYSQPSNYNSSFWGKPVQFRTFFMLAPNASFNSTSVNNLATKLVNDLAGNFKFPQLNDNDQVLVNVVNNNRFRLQNSLGFEYDLLSAGTPVYKFGQQGIVGVSDGGYTVSSVPLENTFTIDLPFESLPGRITFLGNAINNNLITTQFEHFFLPGTPVKYNNNGNDDIDGLVNDQQYYVYVADENTIGLAAQYEDALQGRVISIVASTNVIHAMTFEIVNGRVAGVGTVKTTAGSKKIIGSEGSLFKRYFKVGDNIGIKDNNTIPGNIENFTISAIADDSNMELTDIVSFSSNATKYFLETKIYTRPDGYAVHRPFDGGVEIAAGTAPDSQIIRQTRKYFRYQSGKGIQTSLAINFNPPIQFETIQGITVNSMESDLLNESDKTFGVSNTGASAYFINNENNPDLTLIRGVTYSFNINTQGHPFHIQTVDGAYSELDEYNLGLSENGAETGTVTFAVPLEAPSTLYYVCGVHSSMGGTINIIDDSEVAYDLCRGTSKYPHRLLKGSQIKVSGASDNTYNGDVIIFRVIDEYTFDYILPQEPLTVVPSGIVQFNMNGYNDAFTRAGMFDFQNGFFFEFDGNILYCVRRSSTQQVSGTVSVINKSNTVIGNNTNFVGQLNENDFVVIRGQSYKIIKIISRTEMVVQPEYKGINATNVILTKTVDTRVPQSEWNLDKGDGTGPSGFKLNINKIQMAYMDYSWYGAGKVRFGFKDNKGHVKYFHEFLHNNRMDEAYMRSGNLPARYEILNGPNPSYAPTLFHWGTSVIMDGRFDNDSSYLFTAQSDTLSFTNGQGVTATANGNSVLTAQYIQSARSYDWYLRLQFPTSDASKFSVGAKLYTSNGSLNGQSVAYTQFSGSNIFVFLFLQRSVSQPAAFPSVPSGTVVNIGLPPSPTSVINLGTEVIPLITIRLAPSVDTSISGSLGARDIINRMQLKLNEIGLILTHDCEVKLILNGDLSTVAWERVPSPSLSQLLSHSSGDKVIGGTEVFSFRASGGSTDNTGVRLSATSNFDLGELIDMGNSILGGDGTYPNGPDILTIAVKVVDTSGINATSPFKASSRITWSESQA
jgi:hypothetical protein